MPPKNPLKTINENDEKLLGTKLLDQSDPGTKKLARKLEKRIIRS